MKVKKFLPIFFALAFAVIFLPKQSFAATGGFMYGQPMYLGSGYGDQSAGSTLGATDDDLGTGATVYYGGSGRNVLWYKFPEPITKVTRIRYTMRFDQANVIVVYGNGQSWSGNTANGTTDVSVNLTNVTGIFFKNNGGNNGAVTDVEMFGPSYPNATNVTHTQTTKDITLSWNNPTETGYTGLKIFKDGSLITTVPSSETSYTITGLSSDTSYSYDLQAVYDDGNLSSKSSYTIKTNPDPVPVTGISETHTYKSAELMWKNPNSTSYIGSNIYKDGVLIGTTKPDDTSFSIKDLTPETDYTFSVESLYSSGDKSVKQDIKVTTDPLPKPTDVTEFTAKAQDFNKVELDWKMPANTDNFSKIILYRDGTKISETTDGITYIDTDVKEKTKYTYSLVVEGTDGTESPGVTATVTTPADTTPPPVITGGELSQLPNGDYLYKWETPTTGEVIVSTGGQEFATVPADQQQITIPKDKVPINSLGEPEISITPVGETGKKGMTQNPGSIGAKENPFTVEGLVKTGMSLIWLIAPFLLLALSFLFVPKFRKLLVRMFRQNKNDFTTSTRRTGEVKEERNEREPNEREKRHPRIKDIKPKVTKEPRLSRAERKTREREERQRTVRAPRERIRTERIRRESRQPRTRRT